MKLYKKGEIPKCRKCGKILERVVETNIKYVWKWEDDSEGYVSDETYYDETKVYCEGCGAELDEDAKKFFLDHIL